MAREKIGSTKTRTRVHSVGTTKPRVHNGGTTAQTAAPRMSSSSSDVGLSSAALAALGAHFKQERRPNAVGGTAQLQSVETCSQYRELFFAPAAEVARTLGAAGAPPLELLHAAPNVFRWAELLTAGEAAYLRELVYGSDPAADFVGSFTQGAIGQEGGGEQVLSERRTTPQAAAVLC